MGDPELHPRLEQLLGSTLAGRYRVDGVIGAGGMGIVFSGQQLNLKREVAIKVLDPEVAADEIGHRRFAREAQSAARLDHPNCLAVFDYGTTDGMHYIVMPRLYGRTLRAELSAATKYQRCLEIFDEILAGLEHAHQAGVIHRDLKPANVFLSRDAGGTETVKLLDFGIAKIVDADADGSFSTRTGLLFGTPAYMSPEQATGEPTDARTDLYSAGIILYRMLTGSIPNAGRSAVDQMRKRASLDVPRLPTIFPPRLADLCHSLCEREAEDRCPSAEVARAELAAILSEADEVDLENLWAAGQSGRASNPDDVTRDEAAYQSIVSNGFVSGPISISQPEVGPTPKTPAESAAESTLERTDPGERRVWWFAAAGVTLGIVGAIVVALNRGAEQPPEVAAGTSADTSADRGEPAGAEPDPLTNPSTRPTPAEPAANRGTSSTEMGVELLQDIAAVNEADPEKALAFHERHARIAALRSVEATGPLLDERIIATMDLVQADQSDAPCKTFDGALSTLGDMDDLKPVAALIKGASVPEGTAVECKGLAKRHEALVKPKRTSKNGATKPRVPKIDAPDNPGDLQGTVTEKLGDDELR